MPNRMPALAGVASLGLLGLLVSAWRASRQRQPALTQRTVRRLAPRRQPDHG